MKRVVALELLVILLVALGATCFLVDYINPMTPDPDLVLRSFEHGRLFFAVVQAPALVSFNPHVQFAPQVDRGQLCIVFSPQFPPERNIPLII